MKALPVRINMNLYFCRNRSIGSTNKSACVVDKAIKLRWPDLPLRTRLGKCLFNQFLDFRIAPYARYLTDDLPGPLTFPKGPSN